MAPLSQELEPPTNPGRFKVWELHGEVQRSIFLAAEASMDGEEYELDPEDEKEFVSVQIIVAPQGKGDDEKMKGVILQANEESAEDFPYMYDARNPVTGRGLGEGIPEELSEHQRWHNVATLRWSGPSFSSSI
jgi:hypothetical protein